MSDTYHFGKYQGKPLCDVPISYLKWSLSECKKMDGILKEAIAGEIANRGHEITVAPTDGKSGPATVVMPLKSGNQIEIKVRKKLSPDEVKEFRRIAKFSEKYLSE